MGKYFGTDGFRGEANVNLTVEHAYKVGRFLGWFYGKNHEDGKAKIVIGKDTRRSSYMFEYSLVAGLTASGADAVNDTLSFAKACRLTTTSAIHKKISFLIYYRIFYYLPILFQTTTLDNLLFLHLILYIFLILHHRLQKLFSIFL